MHTDKINLTEMSEMIRRQNDMPIFPTIQGNPIDHRTVRKDYIDAITLSRLQSSSESNERHRQRDRVSKFRETYIKLRTDNIVLDHQTAIELAKMIYADADTITYDELL